MTKSGSEEIKREATKFEEMVDNNRNETSFNLKKIHLQEDDWFNKKKVQKRQLAKKNFENL